MNVKNSGDQAELDDTNDPYISKDGRFGVFSSDAEDLLLSDDNGFTDIFIRGPLH